MIGGRAKQDRAGDSPMFYSDTGAAIGPFYMTWAEVMDAVKIAVSISTMRSLPKDNCALIVIPTSLISSTAEPREFMAERPSNGARGFSGYRVLAALCSRNPRGYLSIVSTRDNCGPIMFCTDSPRAQCLTAHQVSKVEEHRCG